MTRQQQYRWKIELRAATVPAEDWVETRIALKGIGRRCRFVERSEAEEAMTKLLRIQPHAVMRIAAV